MPFRSFPKARLVLVASALLSIASPALADKFKRFDDLKKPEQQRLKPLADATVDLNFDKGFHCTGILVGQTGEMITALHCIEKCLIEAGVAPAEPILPGTAVIEGELAKRIVTLPPSSTQAPVTCRVRIGWGDTAPSYDAEVKHVFGPGFLSPRAKLPDFDDQHHAELLALRRQGFDGSGDMVLMRLPIASPSCVKIAPADFSTATPPQLLGLSYPIIFRADDTPVHVTEIFSMGHTLLHTVGEGTSNPDLIAAKFANEASATTAQELITPGTILTSTDVEEGASGSAIYGADGHVVAMVRATFNARMHYAPWRTQAVDLSFHAAALQALLPDNKTCF